MASKETALHIALMCMWIRSVVATFSCFEKNPSACRNLYYGYTFNLDIYSYMQNSSQLICPFECEGVAIKTDCVNCFCARDYQLDVNSVGLLNVSDGPDKTLFELLPQNKSYYQVIFVESNLTKWPLNLCKYTTIVHIDFHKNELKNIGNIRCLSELDILKLSYNKITYIPSDTFVGLEKLRMVDVSHNLINTVEPETFTEKSLGVLFLEFQYNNISLIDVSNIFLDERFCVVNYSHNEINEISHVPGWKVKHDLHYGPGVISLNSNLFEYINFQDLDEKDIAVAFGKMFDFGFDITDNKWICDCRMVPLLKIASDVNIHVWKDYYDVRCSQPDELKNQSIPQLLMDAKLDKFICNVTYQCPASCQCFDQPSRNTTVINCDNAGLSALPTVLPERPNLEIHLANNNIPLLDSKRYFRNTTFLNMTNNGLKTITDAGAIILRDIKIVILDNNSLRSLPRALHLADPCALHFGLVNLTCTCDLLWINSWMENKNGNSCPNLHQFKCLRNGELVDIQLEDENTMGCDTYVTLALEDLWILMGLVVLFVIIVCVEIYFFRYEIFLIFRRMCGHTKRHHSYKMTERVFISFDETEQNLREWVEGPLKDFLTKQNMQIFLPCRDLQLGQIREKETAIAMQASRFIIAIFSRSYFNRDSFWPKFEWKRAWDLYFKDRKRKIIIIKYDSIKTARIRSAKAFLRLKFFIDISIDEDIFLDRLTNELGTRHVVCDPADEFPDAL